MIVLDEKNIASTITLSDDALMAEYNLNKSRFSTPERRHVQQAIVETTEAADAVLAALAKQGTDKNLKNAVKTATGKETAYLGEQAFEQKGMLEALAKPTFDAAINDVIGPVQSPLGFHILVVKKILPAEVKPFDAVKAELKKDLTERRLSNALYEAANIIDDRLASGETLEAIAADMSLKIAKYGPVRADGSSPDDREAMKDFAQDRSFIMQSVFDMNEGEAAPVLELKDGRYAAIRVDTITPRSFKPYESVKAEIAKTWLEDQKAAANRTRALEWQQAVSSGEKTLADAAREAGLRTQTLNLKRSGQPPQPIDAAAQQQLFNAVKGETTLAATADGFVLAVIKDASLPPADLVTDAQLKPITDAAVRDQREELLLSTMQHLEKKFGVRFNRATLDRLYGPESAY
jgi:peptidyl-prolyl cis-trans isomerase D